MLVIVLIVLAAIVVAAIPMLWFVRRLRAARQRVDDRLAALDIRRKDSANFYGVESKGKAQVRGLGALVLTPDELVFLRLMPEGEIRVPRRAILRTEVARGFLGKTQGRELLVVAWATDGGEDRVAFLVNDVAGWRAALA